MQYQILRTNIMRWELCGRQRGKFAKYILGVKGERNSVKLSYEENHDIPKYHFCLFSTREHFHRDVTLA